MIYTDDVKKRIFSYAEDSKKMLTNVVIKNIGGERYKCIVISDYPVRVLPSHSLEWAA